MIASRASSFVVATIGGLVVLAPVRSDAQWWRSAPVDFESCADVAEKAKTKEEKTAKLAECNAKFAGRRKPGGGYTYYDFMQDRTFDIAGPQPDAGRAEENRRAIYRLPRARAAQQHRRGAGGQAATAGAAAGAGMAAGLAAHRTGRSPPPAETEKVPVPVASPVKQAARIKAAQCAKNQFSCEWPRLSESINELKRLFNPQQPARRPSRRRARYFCRPCLVRNWHERRDPYRVIHR